MAVLTGHNEYFGFDAGMLKGLMKQEHPVIVDGRNVVDADGFIGEGLCIRRLGGGIKNGHSINNQFEQGDAAIYLRHG